MPKPKSFRDLTRSPDGEISRDDFVRGGKPLFILTVSCIALFLGVDGLRQTMDWMTVVIAPIYGVLLIFAVSSIVYFWYCLLVKRFRADGRNLLYATAWIGTLFLMFVAILLDYQNRSLNLSSGGWWTLLPYLTWIFAILTLFLFTVAIVMAMMTDRKS